MTIEFPYRYQNLPGTQGNFEYLYLVSSAIGLCKIGTSSDPTKRFRQLHTASPVVLTLLGYVKYNRRDFLETNLHTLFSHKRKKGEWFDLSKEQILSFPVMFPDGQWWVESDFSSWLRKQAKRDDIVGDFASDWHRDSDAPKTEKNLAKIYAYLVRRRAGPFVLQAFHDAGQEFMGEQENASPTIASSYPEYFRNFGR